MIVLRLYSRPGCHLCEDMHALVQRVVSTMTNGVSLEEVDISNDEDLEARYGEEIPVLEVNGRKVAKYRIAEDALRTVLERAGGSGRSAG